MRVYLGLLLLVFTSCSGVRNTKLAQVDKENIERNLYALASDEFEGRDSDKAGGHKAADFIVSQLTSYGVKPYFESYYDTLSNYANSWNVVGFIPGYDLELKDEIIVLGAHYDHIGFVNSIDGDSIANGANDNAAGVAITLELARNLAAVKSKRSIMIALFSAEERGLLGAKHLASKLKENGSNVVSMLNFEMLGIPMERDFLAYLTGIDDSNLGETVNNLAGEQIVGRLDKAEEFKLFKRSDNYPFYEIFKVPSQTFSSFDFENYEYYHHVKDEAVHMDLEFMNTFTKKMVPVIKSIANLPTGIIRMN